MARLHGRVYNGGDERAKESHISFNQSSGKGVQ